MNDNNNFCIYFTLYVQFYDKYTCKKNKNYHVLKNKLCRCLLASFSSMFFQIVLVKKEISNKYYQFVLPLLFSYTSGTVPI